MAEKYFYGQGKVYLAARGANGAILAQRWVGDVSELNIELSTEELTHKESYSGQRATVRRFNISKDGTLSMTMHDHSVENLAFVLYGEKLDIAAGNTKEEFAAPALAGDRLALQYPQVDSVIVTDSASTALVEGTDYTVDKKYGAITFELDNTNAPFSIEYNYKASKITSMFSRLPQDVGFRYEGVNLAENGEPVIVELYKVQFSPTSGLSLINNDTSLAGLPVTAGIMMDTMRPSDDRFGQFGRIINAADE